MISYENILRWLDPYLTNRAQCVSVDSLFSPESPVFSGVPQGSVLGPLLFLIFINDLKIHHPNVQSRFFADDCVLFAKVNNPSDQEELNYCLSLLHAWCIKWNMVLNCKKCVQMTVTRKNNPLFFYIFYQWSTARVC